MQPTVCIALVFLCTDLCAQLSGAFTIDPNGSGVRNFKTFAQCLFALRTTGVSGAVTVDIADGGYAETLDLYAIPGASRANLVTLRAKNPGKVVLTPYGAGQYIFRMRSTPRDEFRGLAFEGLRIVANGQARNDPSMEVVGSDVAFRRCSFQKVALHMSGPSMAVEECQFQSGNGGALRLIGPDCLLRGSFIYGVQPGNGGSIRVARIEGVVSVGRRGRVYNNVMVSSQLGWFAVGKGLDVYHNTIVRLSYGSTSDQSPVLTVTTAFATYPAVHNNIICGLHGGQLLEVVGAISPHFVRLDQNLYFGGTKHQGFVTSGGVKAVALWAFRNATSLEQNGREADPRFVALGASPAGYKVRGDSSAINLTGVLPTYITKDFGGVARTLPGTAGAFQGPRRPLFAKHGAGCRGTFSVVPEIGYSGSLALDSKDFKITLERALGGLAVQGFLAIGVQATSVNLGGSCNLLVNPLVILQTNVAGTGGGTGKAAFPIPLPSNPAFRGLNVHFQWAVADPAAAGVGLAVTRRATITM